MKSLNSFKLFLSHVKFAWRCAHSYENPTATPPIELTATVLYLATMPHLFLPGNDHFFWTNQNVLFTKSAITSECHNIFG